MKLGDIKTEQQFWDFSDIWYQRVHQLNAIWQNPDESFKRKIKAFVLWNIMKERVLKLMSIGTRLKTPIMPNLESGGTTMVGKNANIEFGVPKSNLNY